MKRKSIVERLRDVIPRHLFAASSSCNRNKIIAETVKALRKDVLAKCYGRYNQKEKLLKSKGRTMRQIDGGGSTGSILQF